MTAGILSLGDPVMVRLPWGAGSFPARVIGFPGQSIRVEAVPRSDDPDVDNEWTLPFSAVTSSRKEQS